MKPLPLRPLPMPLEPLTDYLERLAHANGYHGKELWSVLDRRGESHEKILSDALNGFTLPEFSGPADPHIDIEVNQFGLQTVDFTRFPRRWCPRCIDAQQWFRPVWRLKAAAVCAEHCLLLLESCPSCGGRTSVPAILRGVCECGVRFMDVAVPAARRHIRLANALEASLRGPVQIELEPTTISMTAPQLVRMLCYVGRLREGPNLHRPGQLASFGDINVSFAIFDGTAILLDNWPGAFWHVLEQHMDAFPDDASVRRVFGALYQVLYRRLRGPENQFLRDAFEAFLLDHWRGELCGRHRLFDKNTLTSHSRHGLARIARAHNIGGKTLRRMVQQEWLPANRFASSTKRQLITIDEKELSAFVPDPGDYLDLRSAARALGIKRTRLRELVGLGAIMADALPTWRRRNQWYFRRSHISEFLNESRHAAEPPENRLALTLNHVLQYWRVTSAELTGLLSAMKQNEILFSMTISEQLRDVRFEESTLRNWLSEHRKSATEWVSVTTAAGTLGLKEEVVYQLVAKNLLTATLVGSKGHITRRISLSSLDLFQRTYIPLAVLAKRNSVSSSALLPRIKAKPVTGPRVDGGRQYFFSRDDVDHLLT